MPGKQNFISSPPKISIIVPVYDVELYLRQCLDSLVNQTLENIEIICINDGSPDNSIGILNEYAQNDSRIMVINQKNMGLSGARNRGLKVATGEYIMFVDGDDWVDLNICEKLYGTASLENADCVMCSYVKEFKNRSVVNHIFKEEYLVLEKNETKYRFHRRLFGLVEKELSRPEDCDLIVSACMQLYRREIAASVDFLDTKLIGTEDALFQIYVYYYFAKFVYIDMPLYHYRKTNQSSLTSTHKTDLFERWQNLYDIMQDFIYKYCDEPVYHEALDNRIVFSMIGLGLNEIYASEKSIIKKARRLKNMLETERYREAYERFKFKCLPLKWKMFFGLCKFKLTLALVFMLLAVEYLRKRQ
ncbi:glycosyltransferase family 2 protein [Sporomusa acidovorans]|nr:glycosyltransferase family 2 protein [Sporomusa acidovorans]